MLQQKTCADNYCCIKQFAYLCIDSFKKICLSHLITLFETVKISLKYKVCDLYTF